MDNKNKIRIAWVHNYDTQVNASSGVFMYQFHEMVSNLNENVEIDLVNVGSVSNPFLLVKKYFKYRKILKGYKILHSQYGSGVGFFVSLFSGVKILSLRGSDWYVTPTPFWSELVHYRLGCFLTRLSIKRYTHVIVMSERMKGEVCATFPSVRVSVIPDPVDLSKFYPIKKNDRSSFKVLFSSVRQLNTGKRFELAERAFNIFNKKFPNSELVFMSGIPHNKVNEYINSVDVILLTSTHEGWPNIIKEGLACNVPFVSTDVSDLAQIVEFTSFCYVCAATPESLSAALEKAYDNRNKEKNLRSFVELMDKTVISRGMVSLYQQIAVNLH